MTLLACGVAPLPYRAPIAAQTEVSECQGCNSPISTKWTRGRSNAVGLGEGGGAPVVKILCPNGVEITSPARAAWSIAKTRRPWPRPAVKCRKRPATTPRTSSRWVPSIPTPGNSGQPLPQLPGPQRGPKIRAQFRYDRGDRGEFGAGARTARTGPFGTDHARLGRRGVLLARPVGAAEGEMKERYSFVVLQERTFPLSNFLNPLVQSAPQLIGIKREKLRHAHVLCRGRLPCLPVPWPRATTLRKAQGPQGVAPTHRVMTSVFPRHTPVQAGGRLCASRYPCPGFPLPRQ